MIEHKEWTLVDDISVEDMMILQDQNIDANKKVEAIVNIFESLRQGGPIITKKISWKDIMVLQAKVNDSIKDFLDQMQK